MTRKKEGRAPSTFGKALVNKQRRGRVKHGASELHVADIVGEDPKNAMGSIVDRNELDEYLAEAMMKEQEFMVEKRAMIMIDNKGKKTHLQAQPSSASSSAAAEADAAAYSSSSSFSSSESSLSAPPLSSLSSDVLLEYEVLRIPRRPAWDASTSAEELDRAEKDTFLEWRRAIAKLEEDRQKLAGAPTDGGRVIGCEITPFERNLQIWRQLWRVLERCDILIQIVDARNPLLFRCPDLDKYIAELSPNKIPLLVLNKADYLTRTARRTWSAYLKAQGIKAVWFSAYEEQRRIEEKGREKRLKREEEAEKMKEKVKAMKRGEKRAFVNTERSSSQADKEKEEQTSTNASTGKDEKQEKDTEHVEEEDEDKEHQDEEETDESESAQLPADDSDIFTSAQLLEYIRRVYREKFPHGKKESDASAHSAASASSAAAGDHHLSDRIQVGMVGYPNVGKSSTINVLLGEKRVSVAATPGKTKHFQTLNIGDDMCLCDCPGLVFPTFLSSRAELLINGVMPIDQMRTYDNYVKPMQLVCNLIPKIQYLHAYSLQFPDDGKTLTAVQLLRAHARLRGFVKDHGQIDESKSARIILKDFVGGKLIFCQPPPNLSAAEQKRFLESFQFGDEFLAVTKRHNLRTDHRHEEEDEEEEHDEKLGKIAAKKVKRKMKRALENQAQNKSSNQSKDEKSSNTSAASVDEADANEDDEDAEDDEEAKEAAETSAATVVPRKINKRAIEATLNDDVDPLSLERLTLADDVSASNGKLTKRALRMQAKSMLRRKKGGKKEKLRAQFANTPMEQVGIRVAVRSADLAYRAGSSHIQSIQYNQISEKLPAGKYGSIAPTDEDNE